MTFQEILDRRDNPVIEIPQSSGNDIYIRLQSGLNLGNQLVVPLQFIRLVNFNLSIGGWDDSHPIDIEEHQIANANFVRMPN